MQTGILNPEKKVRTGGLFLLPAAACFFLALVWSSTCLAQIPPPEQSGWFVRMDRFSAGAHGTLKCEECHGSMTDGNVVHPDPEAALYLKKDLRRTFDYQACRKCHQTAHDRFLKGSHAKALEKEKKEKKPSETGFAPTCGDCHSAHYVKSHQTRVAVGREMTQTCGTCHPDQMESYLADYHGKTAVNLAYEKAAFCTDCHGAHTTVALKDRQVILKTCRRCHADASAGFADIIIHDTAKTLSEKTDAKQSDLKRVLFLGSLSLIFVAGVLVFFYAHTGLLMLRKLHEKLRRHK